MESQQDEQIQPPVEPVAAAPERSEAATEQAETPVEQPLAVVEQPIVATKQSAFTPAPVAAAPAKLERNARKERVGKVTSNKMQKTITVSVNRQVKAKMYGKFMTLTKKLTVHDENNECGIGDTVRVMETRPLSKNKRWRLIEIIEKAK
jgi:small subunit ribosomal protein S17